MEPQTPPNASAAAVKAAPKPTPKWQRWMSVLAGALIAIAAGVKFFGSIWDSNHLPGCDSQDARDTLSDIFKEKKLSPTGYNQVKTVSEANDKVVCQADLAMPDKGTIHVGYEFFWEGSKREIKYSITAPQ